MSGIDQKAYLKKYLGIGKRSGEKKKKKKTKKLGPNRLTIVDDDVDVLLNEQIKEDLNAAEDEDAPQIVSVIDERPPSLRIDEVSKNKLWLPIGETIDISAASVGVKFEGNIKLEGNKSQSNKLATKHLKKEKKQSECDGGGILLPNEIKKEKDEDISPPRNRTNHLSDSSPPRRIKREKSEDISPPRKSIRSSPLRDRDSNIKKEKSADISPPRRSTRRFPTPDISPPRRKRSAPNSPESTRRKSYRNSDITPPHKSNQNSPLGERPTNIKRAKSADISPPRRPNRRSPTADRDISPPRRRRNSPNSPESTRRKQSRNEDVSPPRRPSHTHQSDHNRSPSRHSNTQKDRDKSGRKKSRWAENDDQTEKLKKTLDGKTAGLQNATDLVAETSQLKQKEDDLFRNMSAEISGANAATVVRKKKKDVDWEEEERKRKKETENKEKYDRWGKGLKQVGDASEKFQNELYEMSKPLARYADDEDLERYLKEQEREGDPMLTYLRQKKRKKAVKEGKPETQVYQGDAPANRFGIRPGYRWDGVDRSNGYEKQWFEVQNARQASVEESYKWSTEDM